VADIMLEKQLEPLSVADKTNSTLSKPKEEEKDFATGNIKQYLGTFYSEELDVNYQITEKDDQLYCAIKSKQPVALQAKNKDSFILGDLLEIKFDRNNQDEITGFSVDAGRVTNLKFKRK
jgi:hypothetical protein